MSGNPDIAKFVRKKIAQDEVCECCIEGVLVVDSVVKTKKCISLIERQGDHALFIFSSRTSPCLSESDLRLEQVFPVDSDLRCASEPPQKDGSSNQEAYLLWLQVKDQKFVLQFKQGAEAKTFVAELHKAIALQTQNAGFGLPSSFSWLDKYRKQTVTSSTATSAEENNPFATDVFDPIKHMNLENNSSRQTSGGFEDDFSAMSSDMISNSFMLKKKSSSRDSLDDILGSEAGHTFTESLDKVAKRQLNLNTGTEMAAGLKPLTARETLVEYLLKERQSEYVDLNNFRVFVGTWNVNGQNASSLEEWLACDKDPPDIYAVGFQELDTSNQAYIFSDSVREVQWQDAVHKYLHPKARYQKVKSIRLVGVLLIVYIKEIHAEHVKLIDTDYVPTGIMGMLGNKGGVSVRLSLHDTSLCFINSHLAAHQGEFERRNQDTQDIETRMKFRQFLPPLTVQDHDIVFWIGDLNYRIDMDINDVKELVSRGALHKLLPKDQLYSQLATNVVYKTYTEGEINFLPTYKYDPGTDNFDSSEKSRIPAWCDRILWKGKGCRQIIYRSHPTLRISDHKPVSALFDAGIKVVERHRYKKVYEDIMKKLDRLENDYLPQVTLAQKEFVFKDVKFAQPQEQILAVANIGQVPVTYEFINKLDEDSHCKPWLKVNPVQAVIPPGDSCEISLEVTVDKTLAYRFNCGHEKIEDILVMHLHGGKDFFIPITGNYVVSSFGSSVEALVQMHGPIREVPTEQLVDLERPGSLDNVDILKEGVRLYACPKEIFRLVDHIWQYGRHQEDLFMQPGLNTEIHQVRDCLDTGVPDMLPGSIHSVVEALVLFLDALAEPVIPYCLYETCLDCANNYLLCKQVVSKVPDCHRNVFKYLCAFLRQLLEEAKFNNLDIKYLAQMFGDVFLRPPPVRMSNVSKNVRRQQARSEEMKKAAFLYHFLAHEYDE
ncbi:inositol polyphosphate 5-phosphatase OCRL-like [Mercenaria mercenaria]|uniref:inositol polyphosphate 5-phosphatase OCRL-like n=1 Tax=Mercenaria mercenaria TaxID=6596 RepID=UPI00234E76E4|nr:inositol polyphosphate 5-phosphatase OCRL-like [Mercenaria mercenaria]